MKLIFLSNQYKYEIEAVMKLFFPAQKFSFYFDEMPDDDGDFVLIRKKSIKKGTLLYVHAQIGSQTARRSSVIEPEASDGRCEMELSKLLFKVMNRLTGISPEWGIMTGVRPVKQVNIMIDKGLDKQQIFKKLQNDFLLAPEKAEIAYDTACSQAPFLSQLEACGGKTFGLYISIPFCPTRCSYCSFISQSASGNGVKKLIPIYIENLCEEIKRTAEITERLGLKPDTVYFGGGTPTTLTAPQLARIMKAVSQAFDLSLVREYTIEAGRPDTITKEKLLAIKGNGCTRISINPQTLNDSVLEEIGRSHTSQQFFDSFELARSLGFDSINTDIIAGLPTDTPESFKNTLDTLTELSPESITVHTLSIKRSAKLNMSDEKQEIFKNPAKTMVDYAAQRLYSNGYKPYYLYKQKNMVENLENIGWVKPGHESLYNIYIMEEVQTIIALGAAASTKLVDVKNGRLKRIFNYKFPLEYNKHFDIMLQRKKDIEDFYAEEK
ncbi:MAG: coproporphyrinogen dehydrogenase HemZ [Oscillospiraceae bacterium]